MKKFYKHFIHYQYCSIFTFQILGVIFINPIEKDHEFNRFLLRMIKESSVALNLC